MKTIRFIDLFAGIGGFRMWYNKEWQTNILQGKFQINGNSKRLTRMDLLRLRLEEFMVSVKRLFGLGSKSWASKREYPKIQTSLEKIMLHGKVMKQVFQHFIKDLWLYMVIQRNVKFAVQQKQRLTTGLI